MILGSAVRRRLPLVGAAAALALAVVACGDDAAVTTTTTTNPSTTIAPGGTATTAPPGSLSDALAMVGTRYGFVATVVLDGVEVTRVEGTVYDGSGSYAVTGGDAVVEYVVSDQGQWARQPGGTWQELLGAAPLADPIAPLTTPLSATVVTSTGDDAVIEAVYDGAVLGFSSGGEVVVTITVRDGAVASISYQATLDGRLATVTTAFDPTAPVVPIQIPPG